MRKLVTTVVAFLAVACGGSAGDSPAAAMQQVASARIGAQGTDSVCGEPFKGASSGTTVSTVEFPFVHNAFTGTAHLSGLGLSQVEFPHDLNLIDKTITGLMTITAANGDDLFARVAGSASFRPDGVTVDLDEVGTFEGGNGRFEGAEGSFSIVGTSNRATGAVVTELDGYLVRNRKCD